MSEYNYTKGKWYGRKGWSSKNDFVKLIQAWDGQVHFAECINNGKHENRGNDYWSFSSKNPLFEADMSIVSPLLPDGHPDKIVAEEHKQEEKIDMQAIQEEAKRKFPIGCKFIPVGDTTTYTLIEDNYTYGIVGNFIHAQGMCGCLYAGKEWATLVSLPETKEKQKFKVGDKVRIIQRKTTNRTGDCPGWDIANGNVGDIGIITYYSEPVRPYFVSRIGSDGYIGSFDEDDLELYQTTEIDFGRLDLEDWLRETKKLNLSLKKLTLHIEYGNTCNYKKVYTKLEYEEDSPESRAKCLYQLWNSKLKEKPIVEKEEEYEDPFNFSIIKKEKFIDDVQSVNVTLRTKKKTIKF